MIEVQDLRKSFGDTRAVDGISFHVEAGETFALLGPNGSGKTTTLKCLVGLTRPTAGKISVDGVDYHENDHRLRTRISFLPQKVAFDEHLTARETLLFFCRLRKLPLSRVEEVIQQFRFAGAANRLVKEFSGGMQQRLGLAVATLPDAPVIVFDEPTVSLDPTGAAEFRESVTALKKAGTTILFSSHLLADVEQLADRVAILIDGRLSAVESVRSLRQAAHSVSRMAVTLKNPAERFIPVAIQAGAEEGALAGEVLLLSAMGAVRLRILHALESAGASIASFHTEQPRLEEIYVRYVHENRAGSFPRSDCRCGVREQIAPACGN